MASLTRRQRDVYAQIPALKGRAKFTSTLRVGIKESDD
jgi:hypothetical protein